ncbi:MAG TPA: YutD family protein [Haloplasmataceae bacterium]
MIVINNKVFELIKEHRDAFNEQAFKERYTEALDKYDIIVGDISSNILRLKGFTTKDQESPAYVKMIPDYLNESCNYNCPYFILKKVKS